MALIYMDIIGIISAGVSLYLDYETLFAMRFAFGFVVGVNSALDLQYVFQYVPNYLSGIYGGLCSAIMLFGLTMGFVLQWIFLVEEPSSYVEDHHYGI